MTIATKQDRKILRHYLLALLSLKVTHSIRGSNFTCFGTYDEHIGACYEQSNSLDYIVCQVCRAQVERPSAEWIKDFMEAL